MLIYHDDNNAPVLEYFQPLPICVRTSSVPAYATPREENSKAGLHGIEHIAEFSEIRRPSGVRQILAFGNEVPAKLISMLRRKYEQVRLDLKVQD